MFLRVIYDAIPISSQCQIATLIHGDALSTVAPGSGSAVARLFKIFRQFEYLTPTLSSKYMRSSSDGPSSGPHCGFLPELLQVSVTQHSSVSSVQLSFGRSTSRPHAHAAPEGPQPSFWGYVGLLHLSGRCSPFLPFVSFIPLHGGQINMMPYLKPVISRQTSAKLITTNVSSIY